MDENTRHAELQGHFTTHSRRDTLATPDVLYKSIRPGGTNPIFCKREAEGTGPRSYP